VSHSAVGFRIPVASNSGASNLNMEAADSSEMFTAIYQNTRRHNLARR